MVYEGNRSSILKITQCLRSCQHFCKIFPPPTTQINHVPVNRGNVSDWLKYYIHLQMDGKKKQLCTLLEPISYRQGIDMTAVNVVRKLISYRNILQCFVVGSRKLISKLLNFMSIQTMTLYLTSAVAIGVDLF